MLNLPNLGYTISDRSDSIVELLEECEKANARAKKVADDAEKSLQVC